MAVHHVDCGDTILLIIAIYVRLKLKIPKIQVSKKLSLVDINTLTPPNLMGLPRLKWAVPVPPGNLAFIIIEKKCFN